MRLRTRLTLRRTLRRLALLILLPLTLLLALRLIWGWEAAHRLATLRADLHTQGIRVDPSDFPDDSSIAPAQNAYYKVQAALDTFTLSDPDRRLVNAEDHEAPFDESMRSPDEIAGLNRIWAANRPSIDQLDDALDKPQAALPAPLFKKCCDTYLTAVPTLRKSRDLARLLNDMAFVAHTAHDDREALRDLRRIVAISRSASLYPGLLPHLVASAERALAAQAVEPLEPTLATRAPAVAVEARCLVADFQDEAAMRDGLLLAWDSEICITTADAAAMFPSHYAWWCRPVMDDDMARMMTGYAHNRPAFRAANWQRATAFFACASDAAPDHYLDVVVSPTGGDAVGAGSGDLKSLEFHTRSLTDSRAALLLLAARLYTSDHGALPPRASDLVPAILAAVPLDPFDPNDAQFRYRLDPQGPTVWSVGENGTDEGAPILFDSSGNKRRRFGGSSNLSDNPPDIVYGAAWRTASPPTRPAAPTVMTPRGIPSPPAPPAASVGN